MAKGVTDTATAHITAMSNVSGAVTGTELNIEDDGETYYNIMALNDNHTGITHDMLFVGPKSTSAYPDNYTSSSAILYQLPWVGTLLTTEGKIGDKLVVTGETKTITANQYHMVLVN